MAGDNRPGAVRRRLGRTGLAVSEISLGCWTLGGPDWNEGQPNGWAGVEEPAAVAAVERALELGCNHFDTADVYGSGRSEQLLGRVLGPRRAQVVLASKVGWFRGTAEHPYHPLHLRHQLEQSLANLRTDWLDLYYFHHADFGPDDCYLDEAVAAMLRFREEGKLRFIGQSAYTPEDFVRLVPRVDPDVLQARAHILDPAMIAPESPVARLIAARDLGFVAFSPLAQGLLLDKYRPERPPVFGAGDTRARSRWFQPEYLRQISPPLQQLKARFGGHPGELARVSLQYVLSYPTVSCVIPGFRNPEQVELNLAAAGRPLARDERDWIAELFSGSMMVA